MRSFSLRDMLFQVHLWTGLILGTVFVLLGISGSVLVYHDELGALLSPRPHVQSEGKPLRVSQLIAAAQTAMPDKRAVQINLADAAHEPAIVRMTDAGRSRSLRVRGGTDVFVDPVTAQILGTGKAGMSPIMRIAHDMHGSLFMGRAGRVTVGWLGVLMLVLGVTGLVIWWPKLAVWKRAFIVRRHARGYALHRELHGATGIWCLVLFLVVTFTGTAIVFPQTTRSSAALVTGAPPAAKPAFNFRRGPNVTPVPDATLMGPDEAIALAQNAEPDARVVSLSLPRGREGAYRVVLRRDGGGPASLVFVDPWHGRVIESGAVTSPADSFVAWQRPLHEGQGLGPVWRVAVFLSGFLPLLFFVTGVTMWLKKRRGRAGMAQGAASGNGALVGDKA